MIGLSLPIKTLIANKRTIYLSLIFLSILLFAIHANAIPRLISYHGVLLDNNDQPVSGVVKMIFRIYDVETAGEAIWTEHHNVQISNGSFDVLLGEVESLSTTIFENDSLYIGVQVGNDEEMTPRKKMASSGYVFNSK